MLQLGRYCISYYNMLLFNNWNEETKERILLIEGIILLSITVLLICLITYLCLQNSRLRKKNKDLQKTCNEALQKAQKVKSRSMDPLYLPDDVPYARNQEAIDELWMNDQVIAVEMHNSASWESGAQSAPTYSELRERCGLPSSGYAPLSQAEIKKGAAITKVPFSSPHYRPSPHLHLRMCFPCTAEHTNSLGTVDYSSLTKGMEAAFVSLFSVIRTTAYLGNKTLLIPISGPELLPQGDDYNKAYSKALLSALKRFVTHDRDLTLSKCLGVKRVVICCCSSKMHTAYAEVMRALQNVRNDSTYNTSSGILQNVQALESPELQSVVVQ